MFIICKNSKQEDVRCFQEDVPCIQEDVPCFQENCKKLYFIASKQGFSSRKTLPDTVFWMKKDAVANIQQKSLIYLST